MIDADRLGDSPGQDPPIESEAVPESLDSQELQFKDQGFVRSDDQDLFPATRKRAGGG